MSYNPSTGIYSLPALYLAVPGTVIIAAQHNTPLEDLATANNYARPIIAGGTGSGTKIGAANSLEVVSYTGVQVLSDAQKAQARSNIDAEQSGGVYVSKTGNYKILATDNKTTFQWTGNGTITFDPAATLGANFECVIWANTGVTLILDPDASETINGAASLLVQGGQSVDIWCNGTAFFAKPTSDALSGPQLQGYYFGLGLTTNATDAANDIDIAVGSAAADVSPYYLMQLTSALTKRIDAAWAVGTNQGGLDTGSVANSTYYIWLIQRSDTGVVDALFSLSSTAPTMPTNYDRKRLIGSLVRASATNGAPSSSLSTTGIRQATPSVNPNTASVDFTGIPAGVKRITALMAPLSMSAAANPLIQLGAGSIQSTGYNGLASVAGSTSISTSASVVTDGLRLVGASTVTGSIGGSIVFERAATGSNLWTYRTNIYSTSLNQLSFSGYVLMTGDVDRLRFTTVAGTALLNGTMNISWEF